MSNSKFFINQGQVSGQCIGDNQQVTMSFGDEPVINATQVSAQKPKVTRDSLVHFVDHGGSHFVGVIVETNIKDNEVVADILVFRTRYTEERFLLDVSHSEDAKPRTWHWIERAQGHD